MAIVTLDLNPTLEAQPHFDLLLADDDSDDRMLFTEALQELPVRATVLMAYDGMMLMNYLKQVPLRLPMVIFLDLNMPLKSGTECLQEIRSNARLQHVPVVILSTTSNQETVDSLHQLGANHYIQKPSEFSRLKLMLGWVLDMAGRQQLRRPVTRQQFHIRAEPSPL